jgi:hypothetical protein
LEIVAARSKTPIGGIVACLSTSPVSHPERR